MQGESAGGKAEGQVLARCSWVSTKISAGYHLHTQTATSAEANPMKPEPQLVIGMDCKMPCFCCGTMDEAQTGAAVQG